MQIYTIPVGLLQTNCYIVASQSQNAVIIDPGAEGERIAKGVKMLGVTPRCILLTHGHHDHIGGIKQLQKAYPGLPVCIGEGDAAMLRDPDKNLANMRYKDAQEYLDLKEDRCLKDGEQLALDELVFTVINTPGHTSGGVTYRCDTTLFSGDTLFYRSVGRTDLYGGDYDTIVASVRRLYALEGDFDVLPGHGEPTTLSQERVSNPYVREK